MNEGSYNNVVRSNSPFSPMTPSTPNTYKANVNRTKTRKWVEAKVQSYDGDDWGNEYEDEYGEPEPEPEPAPRVAALRQQANSQQPRTFSQSSTGIVNSSNRPGPFGARGPSGPPSLHIQTGADLGSRPVDTTTFASDQGSASSRLPLRDGSRSREGAPLSEINAPGSGSRPGSISTQLWTQRAASPTKSSNLVRPSDLYNRADEDKEKKGKPMESGGLSIEGSYGRGSAVESEGERTNQRRLSPSPKLPDLARLSGFGDDFFSTPGNYNPRARSTLSTITDTQRTDGARDAPGPLTGPDSKRRDTAGITDGKNPSGVLVGPKLEPNPQIIMPPVDADLEPNKSNTVNTSHQSTVLRPQLPGTWVSETISVDSGHPTPTEKVEGPGPASLGSIANTSVPPMSIGHAEPADLEPTTAIRRLPTKYDDPDATTENKSMRTSENEFNNATGKHDDIVASKVIAAGPGYHPTPRSLPPLKTDNHLASPNTASPDKREASGVANMGLPALQYSDSPRQPPSARQSATASSGFTPTAPLNPRRSIIAPTEFATPTIQERKSTMSTVHTASPEKESDKLREEIIKSLSASPATTPDASTILGASNTAFDPTQGSPTRESTYLSDVYDDYLAPVEDKSLQETGLLLKQGSKVANYGIDDTGTEPELERDLQEGSTFPGIAPLSPRRSPEQGTARPQKRFSWENDPKKGVPSSAGGTPSVLTTPSEPTKSNQIEYQHPLTTELGSGATPSNALQIRTESRATISHQVSDVSSRAPGDLSITGLDSPSPVSLVTDNGPRTQSAAPETSRLSFADEKEQVLIQSSSNTSSSEQHPALAQPIELISEPSPALQPAPIAQPSSQGKIMAFRDILNIVSIEQRIQKFDETRAQFYSMDSGLSNWIMHMQSQPEHGIASTTSTGGRMSPSGVQSQAEQPYYQQYLNASNPDAPVQRGRAASGNLQQMLTGQSMSNFGSSGAQVGTKSKELLQAAGAFGNKGVKSGMKLFNKGKNKLRGTGDKGFFQ
ncbi:uncharacterized protein F4817DRAFT_354589 [Daldinia loculata]|uniref:uncharacterized protein n=1 Tax=Daldinia loculata TaxID=103429 RepID=UPI0020C35734|nr:uncharacterized protein F4817DRAFT_354589 [Daldinia loculata]KAI1641862.1 hypothetical protein F4817DRAFT_354589 [Daldinia loculata]